MLLCVNLAGSLLLALGVCSHILSRNAAAFYQRTNSSPSADGEISTVSFTHPCNLPAIDCMIFALEQGFQKKGRSDASSAHFCNVWQP